MLKTAVRSGAMSLSLGAAAMFAGSALADESAIPETTGVVRLLRADLKAVAEGGDPTGVFRAPGGETIATTAGNWFEDA